MNEYFSTIFGSGGEMIDALFAIVMIVLLVIVLFRLTRNLYRFAVIVYWGIKLDDESFKIKKEALAQKWTKKS